MANQFILIFKHQDTYFFHKLIDLLFAKIKSWKYLMDTFRNRNYDFFLQLI